MFITILFHIFISVLVLGLGHHFSNRLIVDHTHTLDGMLAHG